MQQEKLHKGSPQVNGVFEFVCNKQSFDKKKFFTNNFLSKKYNAWSNRTKSKILKRAEHENDLAG